MHFVLRNGACRQWVINKIVVIGPGIVGLPMAALLARAKIKIGCEKPAKVIILQRNSSTSGWKVNAINSGKSTIGGIEPDLDKIVSETVANGLLSATYDYDTIIDADVILVCVQTDQRDLKPDYGPLSEALEEIASRLQQKPAEKVPLIIFESTLAPSSMATLIKDFFLKYNLTDGEDILLGNSPNRVMPGRLVERITHSGKIVAGLYPETPKLIHCLYSNMVPEGTMHPTNSLTAEIVKTMENAYRDVRIAYSAEIVRYCDNHDIDFYPLRQQVNRRLGQIDTASSNPNIVPTGAMLIPVIGVGGHCLPKDGILLWWRLLEQGVATSASLILAAREINNDSPMATVQFLETSVGDLTGKTIALLGAAYRFNSEDTRNSPTFTLAKILLKKKCHVIIHDPFVKPWDYYLLNFKLNNHFLQNLEPVLANADIAIFCTAHQIYIQEKETIKRLAPSLKVIFDGCNVFQQNDWTGLKIKYTGIGRGKKKPPEDLIDFVFQGFKAVEKGFANEMLNLVTFFNRYYVEDDFNIIDFKKIQRLASTCDTGCNIVTPGPVTPIARYDNFMPTLVTCALN